MTSAIQPAACPQCGGTLDFATGARRTDCGWCGHRLDLAVSLRHDGTPITDAIDLIALDVEYQRHERESKESLLQFQAIVALVLITVMAATMSVIDLCVN